MAVLKLEALANAMEKKNARWTPRQNPQGESTFRFALERPWESEGSTATRRS
jgi:hypothetical protein